MNEANRILPELQRLSYSTAGLLEKKKTIRSSDGFSDRSFRQADPAGSGNLTYPMRRACLDCNLSY